MYIKKKKKKEEGGHGPHGIKNKQIIWRWDIIYLYIRYMKN